VWEGPGVESGGPQLSTPRQIPQPGWGLAGGGPRAAKAARLLQAPTVEGADEP